MKITERPSDLPNINPVKEKINIRISDVNEHLPHLNGFVWGLIGTGGSGKSSLLLSMFTHREYYRSKFDNIYMFVNEGSYLSVKNHPFRDHEHVYHELTTDVLDEISDELLELKKEAIDEGWPIETNLIIINDMANILKSNNLVEHLCSMILKSRHLSVCWIFTLQSYNLMHLTIRKQFTNVTVFRPKNKKETELLIEEIISMTKEDALKLFNYVFDVKFNHLDVDTTTGQMYKNFNPLTIIDKENYIPPAKSEDVKEHKEEVVKKKSKTKKK